MNPVTSYNPLPISFSHGQGIWLYDVQGHAYLDSFSGIAVCGLGHAHPDITRTITEQAGKLLHTSNAFVIPEQQRLAERLTKLSGMEQVFFSNSGAEANEAAIKLARLYGHSKGIETPTIVVMEKAFHGRSMATLSASNPKIQAGFEPLVPGFVRVPFNDLQAIEALAAERQDLVAVMLEPIQGEGGIVVGDETYLRNLAAFCKTRGLLLILDEIQTGNGRTGSLFACMQLGIQPDILTTAKGLGNGMPIGACLMSQRACNLFKPGNHGSTFGGNPLACAVALTVLDIIERERACEQIKRRGKQLMEALQHALGSHPRVKDIRGKGYMLGIELDQPAAELKTIGLKHRILINVTADNVVRLLPSLLISDDEIHELVTRLVRTLNDWQPLQE